MKKIDDNLIKGSTSEKECPSDIRRVKYEISEVTINKNELISWDRGFDENSKQVWGATTGGYIFKRLNN